MALVRPFHRYRGESAFTLPQLIEVLKELIPKVLSRQTKYRVTDFPTERTIRFYTANGLVDKPSGSRGLRALYGYRHVLQVLAVKYLQSHYLPLVKIRSLVENISNRELEQMIPDHQPTSGGHRAFIREDRQPAELPPREPTCAGGACPPGGAPLAGGEEPEAADCWHRLEVAPGVELHVHAAALSGAHRRRLRGVLLREIGVLRGWFGEEQQ